MERMGEGVERAPIFDFEAKAIDGKLKKLADYQGDVLMIVNTASQCGFTRQYEALEQLFQRYKSHGLRILAFPCNDFGSQEPGTDQEIREFCRKSYSVSFDLFSKIRVKGPTAHPLYAYLTREAGFDGDITWNFTKFLVGRQGKVVARFGPNAEPLSMSVVGAIQDLI